MPKRRITSSYSRLGRLRILARREKEFNRDFGTNDKRYQNLLKKAKTGKKRKSSTSSSSYGSIWASIWG